MEDEGGLELVVIDSGVDGRYDAWWQCRGVGMIWCDSGGVVVLRCWW